MENWVRLESKSRDSSVLGTSAGEQTFGIRRRGAALNASQDLKKVHAVLNTF